MPYGLPNLGAPIRTARSGASLRKATIRAFPLPDPQSHPTGITTGSDGNLWAVGFRGDNVPKGMIWRMTPREGSVHPQAWLVSFRHHGRIRWDLSVSVKIMTTIPSTGTDWTASPSQVRSANSPCRHQEVAQELLRAVLASRSGF